MNLNRFERYRNIDTSDKAVIAGVVTTTLVGIMAIFVCIAGYITHIIVTLKTAAYVLLLVGVLAPPVGIIHGVGCWFNVWSQ